MRFAMYVPNFGTFAHVSTVVELAKAAEHTGWDGFFLFFSRYSPQNLAFTKYSYSIHN